MAILWQQTGGDSSGSSQTLQITGVQKAGTDPVLVVTISYKNNSGGMITGVTWNTTEDFIQIGSESRNGDANVSLWALIPSASGFQNIDITFSTNVRCSASGSRYIGADQTNPFRIAAVADANGTDDIPTVDVVALNGEMVIDALCQVSNGPDTIIDNTGDALRFNQAGTGGGSDTRGAMQELASSGTTETMGYTMSDSDNWAIIAAPLQGPSGLTATPQYNAKAQIKNTITYQFNGEGIVKDTITEQFNGEADVEATFTATPQYNGKGNVKSKTTEQYNGKGNVKSSIAEQFNGESKIFKMLTEQFNGQGQVKSTIAEQFNGEAVVEAPDYPDVDGRSSGSLAASFNPVLNVPAGLVEGDTLLVFLGTWAAPSVTWPSADEDSKFNQIFIGANSTFNQLAVAWHRVTSVGLGATITAGLGQSVKCSYSMVRISNDDNPFFVAPTVSASATGSSANPNALNCNPGTPQDRLWITCAQWAGSGVVSTDPSGYSNRNGSTNGGGLACGCYTTELKKVGSAEDAGQWVSNLSDTWVAVTVAIHQVLSPATIWLNGRSHIHKVITSQFNGLGNVKSSITEQYNGKGNVKSSITEQFNGEADVLSGGLFTTQFNGKGQVKSTITYQFNGKGQIKSTITYQFNGEGNVKSSITEQYNGKGQVKSSITVQFDGEGNVKSTITEQFNGEADVTAGGLFTTQFNGKGQVKDSITLQFDGGTYIYKVTTPQFDGRGKVFKVITPQFNGMGNIKSAITEQYNGKGNVKSVITEQYNGMAIVKSLITKQFNGEAVVVGATIVTFQFDGEAVIKDTITIQFNGEGRVSDGIPVDLVTRSLDVRIGSEEVQHVKIGDIVRHVRLDR